jgi:hypothetical protein
MRIQKQTNPVGDIEHCRHCRKRPSCLPLLLPELRLCGRVKLGFEKSGNSWVNLPAEQPPRSMYPALPDRTEGIDIGATANAHDRLGTPPTWVVERRARFLLLALANAEAVDDDDVDLIGDIRLRQNGIQVVLLNSRRWRLVSAGPIGTTPERDEM